MPSSLHFSVCAASSIPRFCHCGLTWRLWKIAKRGTVSRLVRHPSLFSVRFFLLRGSFTFVLCDHLWRRTSSSPGSTRSMQVKVLGDGRVQHEGIATTRNRNKSIDLAIQQCREEQKSARSAFNSWLGRCGVVRRRAAAPPMKNIGPFHVESPQFLFQEGGWRRKPTGRFCLSFETPALSCFLHPLRSTISTQQIPDAPAASLPPRH